MGSFNHSAFDPLDLEIIDLVYEVAWEQISAREPSRDMAQDEEWQALLRKRVFDLAGSGGVDFLDTSHAKRAPTLQTKSPARDGAEFAIWWLPIRKSRNHRYRFPASPTLKCRH